MIYYKSFFIQIATILLPIQIVGVKCEEFHSSSDYLQSAIRDIIIKNSERNIQLIETPLPPIRKIVTTTLHIDGNRRFSGGEPLVEPTLIAQEAQQRTRQTIPDPPSLTKGELAALYEAAVSAGRIVHMNPNIGGNMPDVEDSLPVQAAVHEIKDHKHNSVIPNAESAESYYYYYYPLKSFMDNVPNSPKATQVPRDHYKSPMVTSFNTHLHNIKLEPIHAMTEAPQKESKALEPLFMAISSFVGMAIMFMFSMILLPRITAGLTGVKKGAVKKNNKKGRQFVDQFSMPDMDWPTLITRLIQMYERVNNCPDDSLLRPYKYKINRNARTKTKK